MPTEQEQGRLETLVATDAMTVEYLQRSSIEQLQRDLGRPAIDKRHLRRIKQRVLGTMHQNRQAARMQGMLDRLEESMAFITPSGYAAIIDSTSIHIIPENEVLPPEVI